MINRINRTTRTVPSPMYMICTFHPELHQR